MKTCRFCLLLCETLKLIISRSSITSKSIPCHQYTPIGITVCIKLTKSIIERLNKRQQNETSAWDHVPLSCSFIMFLCRHSFLIWYVHLYYYFFSSLLFAALLHKIKEAHQKRQNKLTKRLCFHFLFFSSLFLLSPFLRFFLLLLLFLHKIMHWSIKQRLLTCLSVCLFVCLSWHLSADCIASKRHWQWCLAIK